MVRNCHSCNGVITDGDEYALGTENNGRTWQLFRWISAAGNSPANAAEIANLGCSEAIALQIMRALNLAGSEKYCDCGDVAERNDCSGSSVGCASPEGLISV